LCWFLLRLRNQRGRSGIERLRASGPLKPPLQGRRLAAPAGTGAVLIAGRGGCGGTKPCPASSLDRHLKTVARRYERRTSRIAKGASPLFNTSARADSQRRRSQGARANCTKTPASGWRPRLCSAHRGRSPVVAFAASARSPGRSEIREKVEPVIAKTQWLVQEPSRWADAAIRGKANARFRSDGGEVIASRPKAPAGASSAGCPQRGRQIARSDRRSATEDRIISREVSRAPRRHLSGRACVYRTKVKKPQAPSMRQGDP
jgi:hypothetical protein